MKSAGGLFLRACLCLSTAACVSVGSDRVLDLTAERARGLLIVDQTTREQVQKALGAGRSVEFASGYEVWLYDDVQGERAPLFLRFVPIVGLFVSNRSGAHIRELKLLFD